MKKRKKKRKKKRMRKRKRKRKRKKKRRNRKRMTPSLLSDSEAQQGQPQTTPPCAAKHRAATTQHTFSLRLTLIAPDEQRGFIWPRHKPARDRDCDNRH
jgi:hypothetical protein